MAAKFGLFVDEDHSKLPTLYWLPKLHKRPYKSRFIANSSACTIGLLRVSEYSDIRGSEYKIEYRYSSLPKSLDRDLFFF